MEIKKFEAYKFEDEMHDDFAEEHAKVVIAAYIDNELNGKSLQECFDTMAADFDLAGAAENNELHQTVKTALVNYLQRMLDDAMDLDTGETKAPLSDVPFTGDN